jgi:hypothetical protein
MHHYLLVQKFSLVGVTVDTHFSTTFTTTPDYSTEPKYDLPENLLLQSLEIITRHKITIKHSTEPSKILL